MAVSIKDSKKVYNMLVEIFLETFGKRINYNAATIKSIPQWDSIKGIQLLLAIEDKFKLKFSSEAEVTSQRSSHGQHTKTDHHVFIMYIKI